MATQYTRKPNTKCDICDAGFYKRPYFKAKTNGNYCSQACFGKSCQKARQCPVCGDIILGRGDRVIFCSRACSNKGRTGGSYKKGRPLDKHARVRAKKDRLFDERGAKCSRCGFDEYPEVLHIHHINERQNGGSDDDCNLEILCPNCHAVEHFLRKTHSITSMSP